METFTPQQSRSQIISCKSFLLGQVLESAVLVFAVAVPAASSWSSSGPERAEVDHASIVDRRDSGKSVPASIIQPPVEDAGGGESRRAPRAE